MTNDKKLNRLEEVFLDPDYEFGRGRYYQEESFITCPECGNTYTYDEVEDNWGTDVLTSYGEEFYHDMCPNCMEILMEDAYEQLRTIAMKWFFEVNEIPFKDVSNNSYFKCKCCGKWHLTENATKAPNGRRYNFCVDCADKDVAYYNHELKEIVVEANDKKCNILQIEEQENKSSMVPAPELKESCIKFFKLMLKRFISLLLLKDPLKKSFTLNLLKSSIGEPIEPKKEEKGEADVTNRI